MHGVHDDMVAGGGVVRGGSDRFGRDELSPDFGKITITGFAGMINQHKLPSSRVE